MNGHIDLVGKSAAIRTLRDEIRHAARSDAKVLLSGESGSGKEVVARLIHAESGRRHAQLVTLNCAGLPETLLETELFGHVRGSFTGAYRDKPGLFERADRGTVFMDEIGEMSPRMQSLLLRFIETGEIQRVGGTRVEPKLNVRVIAASNRNLLDAVSSGTFRHDLFYRLNVIHLRVPPLRERLEDVSLLLDHFIDLFDRQYGTGRLDITPEACAQLSRYTWPGNVRELRNLVERLIVRAGSGAVTLADLPAEVWPTSKPVSLPAPARETIADVMFDRMVKGGESFWSVVHAPFNCRDLTRDDLRQIVSRGLARTGGSYRALVGLLNMEPGDYKRFLNFLRKHHCQVPFHSFRGGMLKSTVLDSSNAADRGPTKVRADAHC